MTSSVAAGRGTLRSQQAVSSFVNRPTPPPHGLPDQGASTQMAQDSNRESFLVLAFSSRKILAYPHR